MTGNESAAKSYLQAPILSRARAWCDKPNGHTHTGIINTCFSDHARVRARTQENTPLLRKALVASLLRSAKLVNIRYC